jgi:hypothetical protein
MSFLMVGACRVEGFLRQAPSLSWRSMVDPLNVHYVSAWKPNQKLPASGLREQGGTADAAKIAWTQAVGH